MNAFLLLGILDHAWVTTGILGGILRFVLIVAIGFPLLYLAARSLGKVLTKRLSPHTGMLASKAMFYLGAAILILSALRELGFELTAVLGAAGIMGVAIGFASQTSLSNIISGLFLVWEKPFQVGDVITIGDVTGAVYSIDLLSTKLRMFDNRFVRIPHEKLIKDNVTNITRFPIRRLDIVIGVAYKESVPHVIKVLKEVADENPHCLDEPEPIVVFQSFADSSLSFLFGVWSARSDFLVLRNSIMGEIKERFEREGIEIPFPHRTLYTGSVTDPFPIRIVDERQEKDGGEPETRKE